MTDLTREQIEALLDGATPGPWACHFGNDNITCDCKYVLADYGGMGSIATIDVCKEMHGEWGDDNGPSVDVAKANARLIAAVPDLARQLLATLDALADAQAAQALVVEKAAKKLERRAELLVQDEGSWEPDTNVTNLPEWVESECEVLEESARLIRDLAPIDGFALVQELRAGVERLNRWRAEEGEKIKRQAKALTDLTKHCQRIEAENAGLARKIGKVQRGDGDHSQIADLEAKVINQRNELANLMARDGRLAELAADRDRLAAANAALEAKVAGLVEALKLARECFNGVLGAEMQDTERRDQGLDLLDAALATQEAGNG